MTNPTSLPATPTADVLTPKRDLAGQVRGVHTRAEAERVAKQFEAMFVGQMLAPMFAGLSTDGLGGGGSGEAAFRPMLIDKYAEALTKQGGFGISDAVLKEILHMQGLE
jgi:Rod binding domain-containing protein